MRYWRFLILFLPLGLNAQHWFKVDSTFTENPFYNQYPTGEKILTKPLFSIVFKDEILNRKDQYIVINPFFDLKIAKGKNDNYIKNGRGILLEGQQGDFKFFSAIQEVQENAYLYQRNLADSNIALRGHNRFKTTENGDFDYADFMGGVEYTGDNVAYSIGWHPVRIGSGIRPAFVSHLNTGFFNYQGKYFSNNKKFILRQGSGILLGDKRLPNNSLSEAGIERYRYSWVSGGFTIVPGLEINFYADAYKPMFSAEGKSLAPSALDYLPLTIFLEDNDGFRRYGGEMAYAQNGYKIYGGLLVNQQIYGGLRFTDVVFNKLYFYGEVQANYYPSSVKNQIGTFGNSFAVPYNNLNYEVLSEFLLNYKNFRSYLNANYFNSEISSGLNFNLALGYCLHKPSELVLKVFTENRKFPNDETYIGIGFQNNLGIAKNTY